MVPAQSAPSLEGRARPLVPLSASVLPASTMQVSVAAASVGPMATLLPELLVTDPAALRAWLEEHHATSPGVRLVLTKKGGSDTTITWASAVEELLCFGWIDGQAGKRDEAATPCASPRAGPRAAGLSETSRSWRRSRSRAG